MSTTLPLIDNLTIYEGDGTVLDFVSHLGDLTGYTITFQAREAIHSRYAFITEVGKITDITGGRYSITIPSSASLSRGGTKTYFYGIQLKDQNGKIHTDRTGELIINPRTTDAYIPPVVAVYGVDVDKDGSDILSKAHVLNFTGSGVNVVKGGTGEVTINIDTLTSPFSIGARFVGIFDTLQALSDAIPKPADNMQAIVIQPSERYYHSVGGTWTTFTHNLTEDRLSSVSFFDEGNGFQNLNSAVLWRPKSGDANSIEVYHSQTKTMTIVFRVYFKEVRMPQIHWSKWNCVLNITIVLLLLLYGLHVCPYW